MDFSRTMLVRWMVLGALLCGWPQLAIAEFQAGAAVRSITPKTPLPVSGGMGVPNPSTKALGELTVRAAVVKQGDACVAFVGIDSLGFPSVLCDRVRALVPAIPAENVLIGSTHTHSAPDCYAFPLPQMPEGHTANFDYIDFVVQQTAEALQAAYDALEPATLKVGTDEAAERIAYNYYAPALYDRRMDVVQAVSRNGTPLFTLVNYAIHPEVLGAGQGVMSPDCIGPMAERIEEQLGGVAVFFNGAQGGMVTADNRLLDQPSNSVTANWEDANTWEECERIGHLMADEAMRIIASAKTQTSPAVVCARRTVTIPVESEELWAVVQHSPLKYPHDAAARTIPVSINLVNLGTAQIATIPGEALPNIGFYLKRKMQGQHNLLFGLTNDAFGYILTKVDYQSFPRYDYISRVCTGEMTGEILIEAILEMVAAAPQPGAIAFQSPVDPSNAPATLATPDDLEAALFAAEPLLTSPSDMDVDAAGRVWVCEVTNYRGRKDTRPEGDRILVLEDTNGDGKADTQTVFYQGRDVDSALGICVIGEGPGRKVIVSCAPNVFVFHDDDGDLVADRKETLFTNTGDPQHDHSVHAFVVGPDGRWYFNFGNTGHQVCDADGTPIVDRFGNTVNDSGRPYRQGMVFRCKPDGSDFEVLGNNFRNNYEVAVDSFGSLWQSDNDDDGNRGVRINAVLEFGNYGYVDERTGAGWRSPRTNLEQEVPLQHWHLNDPGVMPNLLQTGGGSPTGICFYEGSLLPERFRQAIIHCDAGPNVVRGYVVAPRGAGYTAEIAPIASGEADRWFRPSDVCVAPDGSLMVADWYDPGVGGHGMGDIDMGRIYRIAPPGVAWQVPEVDFSTVAGCVAALASPNHCARATALERLAAEPEAAVAALTAAYEKTDVAHLKARYAWAAGMLPDAAAPWIDRLIDEDDDRLRAVAIRLCRRVEGDILGLVARCTADPSSLVRREAVIAVRGLSGATADRLWAVLASRHEAGDRWETEAIGVGADSPAGFDGENLWDGRLAAWLELVGSSWNTAAGREIVWRSRGRRTPELLCRLIADPATTAPEALSLIRSLDFQDAELVHAAVATLLRGEQPLGRVDAVEWTAIVLPELVLRLERADMADGVLRKQVAAAADATLQTPKFVELVGRFDLRERAADLVSLAATAGTDDGLAADAVRLAIGMEAGDQVRAAVATDDEAAGRLLEALGIRPDDACMAVLRNVVGDQSAPLSRRAAAVRGTARSQRGCRYLIRAAGEGRLEGPLAETAAAAISACPWGDIRGEAAAVLPMPKARDGVDLPPVADLVRRSGNAEAGRAVFMGIGTCIKCHKVGDEGKTVGPELSEIGRKLSKTAFYEAILAPSAAISHNYETWTALTSGGQSVTGLLISQTPQEVTLRAADGVDTRIARDELDELVKQPVSLMPADLAATMSADDLVDLVAWLETLRGS